MRRRDFIKIIAAASATALPRDSFGQARMFRIGYLANLAPEATPDLFGAFREALRTRGYVEGQNLTIIPRSAQEISDAMAIELVELKPDVIVAWATPAASAVKRATNVIPIVMVGIADPVAVGFVASFSRPGGNITGTTNLARDLGGKMLELLIETVPTLTSVTVIRNPNNPASTFQFKDIEAAARVLKRQVIAVDVSTDADLDNAFAFMRREGTKAAVALADPFLIERRERIASLALAARLPIIFSRRENVEAGGFIAYGPSLRGQFRDTAAYVDRILKGANPAELPVQQPTTFELVVNLKTAKTLGLKISESFLLRADEVME